MRSLLLLLAVAGAPFASGAVATSRSETPQRTVPCGEVIARVAFPYAGGYRLVLGAVSVPPGYLAQVSPTRSRPWAYFSKHGLVVRSGEEPLTIAVPRAWRKRVGIVWGNGGLGVFHTIRLAACPADPVQGNAYAGGFFLRRPSDCVPLVFVSGGRRATVGFGVGRRCPR
jgi:hypothetical protein